MIEQIIEFVTNPSTIEHVVAFAADPYAITTTTGAILYALTQLFAIFGKPRWSGRVRKLSKVVDVLTGNHSKCVNLIDSGKTTSEIEKIQAANRHRPKL